MANDLNNIVVGKPAVTGGILAAPTGTTLPTDEVIALDAAFVAVGYAVDTGVTRSEKRSADTKYAWGGDTLAVLQKSFDVTFKFGMAEYLNPTTQKLIYGDTNVITTAATTTVGAKMTVKLTSAPCPHKAWVFEMFYDLAKVRLVVPNGQITDLDDVSYQDDALAVRGLTLTLFPDANGVYVYDYTNDGVHI